MNDKQRLLVMIGSGSIMVFLITILGLGFSPIYTWIDTSEINWKYEKSKVQWSDRDEWTEWAEKLKKEQGIKRTKVGLPLLFQRPNKEDEKTNWLGIISIFNITFCIVGFNLFKDT